MRELQSYTIDELEEATGVSRRNIRLYISMGLLPNVGRRGRRTRYGQEYVDRLNFIQRVKQLQDAGQLPHSTLDYLGSFLGHDLAPEEIAEGSRSNQRLMELFERRRERAQSRRDESLDRVRPRLEDPDPYPVSPQEGEFSQEPGDWWETSSGGVESKRSADFAPDVNTFLTADNNVAEEGADLEALREELSVTRLRMQTEIQELNKLANEAKSLRSKLKQEVRGLKAKLRGIRRGSDE